MWTKYFLPMKLIHRQFTGNFSFIVLAFASLSLLISTAWIAIQQPYSGIQWSFRTGDITSIFPDSPAVKLIQIGSRIISINSKPVLSAREFPGKSAGDLVTLVYKNREGLIRNVTFYLVQPSMAEFTNRLGIFGITIIFWLLGGLILWTNRTNVVQLSLWRNENLYSQTKNGPD